MKRFQPLLLAAMMTCIAVPLVVLGETLSDDWQGMYVLVVVPLVVLEGIWSKRIYQRERLSGASLAWRLIAEGVVLMFILKLFGYLGHGFQHFLDDLASWTRHPSTFITQDFVLLMPVVIAVWSMSQKLQTDLKRLSDPLDSGEYRQSARESIRGFVLFGGAWLLCSSGLILGLAKDYFSLSRGSSTLLEAAVICYLGLSLLLLAHMQYLRMRIEWQLEGLSVPDVIARRWVLWGLTLVIGIFLIAALLPAAYRYGPEQMILRALDFLLYLVQLVVALIILLMTPFMWLLNLIGGEGSPVENPPTELPEFPPPSIGTTPLWWINLRQVLQYIIILVLIVIVFFTYSRNRAFKIPQPGDILLRFKQKLLDIWLWFTGLFSGAHASLELFRLTRRHPTEPTQKESSKKWSLYHAFTARARVRRYYFSLLRRASEAGLQRTPQQTPQEFATELTSKLPEQRADLAVLTDAFIHARYDAREVCEGDVPLVRRAWYAIRNILRKSSVKSHD
jgi:hypothetical protein